MNVSRYNYNFWNTLGEDQIVTIDKIKDATSFVNSFLSYKGSAIIKL